MASTDEQRAAVVKAILEGRGKTSGEARRRAFEGDGGDGPVGAYLATARDHAYRVTDEEVAAVRAAGLGDDEIFELTVATAVGQATRQREAAVRALDAALAVPALARAAGVR